MSVANEMGAPSGRGIDAGAPPAGPGVPAGSERRLSAAASAGRLPSRTAAGRTAAAARRHEAATAGPEPGRLFADPVAGAVWTAVLHLDVAVQHDFLAALREKLAVPAVTEESHRTRLARMVASVREAFEMLAQEAAREAVRDSIADVEAAGREQLVGAGEGLGPEGPVRLTEERYNELRARHLDHAWLPASTMRSWVRGSWNDVLRRANLDTVEGGDAVVAQTGGAYTWAEVRLALRQCAEFWRERGQRDFTYHDYLTWARLPETLSLPGRRPRSQLPFDTRGGFTACRVQAYIGPDAPPPDGGREAGGAHWRPSSGYGYEQAQLKAALDEVFERLGRVPKPGEYQATRRAILDEEADRRLPARPFASYNTLIHTWKPWDAVLVACGYEPFADVVVDGQTGRGRYVAPDRHVISERDLFAGVREAFEAKGKPFSLPVYQQYLLERDYISKAGRPMATYAGIYSRFRHRTRAPWRWVCDQALPAGWNRRPREGERNGQTR